MKQWIFIISFVCFNAFMFSGATALALSFDGEDISVDLQLDPRIDSEAAALSACSRQGFRSYWSVGGRRFICSNSLSKARICASRGGVNAAGVGCNQEKETADRGDVAAGSCANKEVSLMCCKRLAGQDAIWQEGDNGTGTCNPKSQEAPAAAAKKGGGPLMIGETCSTNDPKYQCASGLQCVPSGELDIGICQEPRNTAAAAVQQGESDAMKTLLNNLRQCNEKAAAAKQECEDETSTAAEDFRKESKNLLGQLGQVQQSAGAVGSFRATSNALLGVEVGMQAMKVACEQKAGDCTRTCAGAKKQETALDESTLYVEERGKPLTKVKEDLAKSIKSCEKHDGAIAAIAKAILENGIARMSSNINADCLSNQMPADMQYCCGKTEIPPSCFQGPYDPNAPATAWNPGAAPLPATATTPACVANPTGPGCVVSAKVTDVANGGVNGLNTGLGGSSSGRRSGGGTPNFNFADDSTKAAEGALGKPTALMPPGGEGGGGGGGLGGGGGMGGGSGGGGGNAGGGGHDGGGSGDSLFDGMRAVGSSDPNKFGGGVGPGGANSMALNGGKAGVQGKAIDGKVAGGYPDLSKGFEAFKGNKSGLRGIAGATGPDGITGPDSNIWKKINNAVLNDQIYLSPIDPAQRK